MTDVGSVLSAAFADFGDHIGGYALAALAVMVVMIPVGMILAMVFYFQFSVGLFGGMMIPVFLAALLEQFIGGELPMLVLFVGELVVFALMVLLLLLLMGLVIAVTSPLGAGLNRLVAEHQAGRAELDFGGVFSRVTQDLVSVVVVNVLVLVPTLIGSMLFLLPGLVVTYFLQWAPLLVIHNRMKPLAAIKRSASLAMSQPGWQLPALGLCLAASFVGQYVPVLGTAFIVALTVRLHREAFGDADAPSPQ